MIEGTKNTNKKKGKVGEQGRRKDGEEGWKK